MRLPDFDTLTFDVVGTLIDFETDILDWFRPALRRYGAAQTDEDILTAFAAVEDDYQREAPEKTFTEIDLLRPNYPENFQRETPTVAGRRMAYSPMRVPEGSHEIYEMLHSLGPTPKI